MESSFAFGVILLVLAYYGRKMAQLWMQDKTSQLEEAVMESMKTRQPQTHQLHNDVKKLKSDQDGVWTTAEMIREEMGI